MSIGIPHHFREVNTTQNATKLYTAIYHFMVHRNLGRNSKLTYSIGWCAYILKLLKNGDHIIHNTIQSTKVCSLNAAHRFNTATYSIYSIRPIIRVWLEKNWFNWSIFTSKSTMLFPTSMSPKLVKYVYYNQLINVWPLIFHNLGNWLLHINLKFRISDHLKWYYR